MIKLRNSLMLSAALLLSATVLLARRPGRATNRVGDGVSAPTR